MTLFQFYTNHFLFRMMTTKRLNYFIACCLSFSLITACTPESLLVEVAPAQSKLVIASQLLPGDVMVVFVTRSFSALEGNGDSLAINFIEQIVVEDADVSLSFNGTTERLSPVDDVAGIYISEPGLDFGDSEIRLDVLDPSTNQRIYAITTALPRISPDSVSLTEEIDGNDTTQMLYYSFTDPIETSNWYVANAFDPGAFADGLENNPLGLVGNDNGTFYEELISDQEFSTDIYENTVTLQQNVQSDTIGFLFSNISEGYFRFLDARQRTGGIIASATSEPITFPSNVIGGFGYFNAQQPSIMIVVKE